MGVLRTWATLPPPGKAGEALKLGLQPGSRNAYFEVAGMGKLARPDMVGPSFQSTRWSVIQRARSAEAPAKDRGLTEFCESYWPPLFAYLRRRGRSAEQAADLVQGFLCGLLERDGLASVGTSDESGGSRFRSWLLTALRNYERDVHAMGTAEKRGGGVIILSLDAQAADEAFGPEAIGGDTPEKAFDRAWALQVLETARTVLAQESLSTGKGDLFRCLEMTLDGEATAEDRAALAKRLGMQPVALRVAIHRLRQRYAQLIRSEVRDTLSLGLGASGVEFVEAEAVEFEVLRRALG